MSNNISTKVKQLDNFFNEEYASRRQSLTRFRLNDELMLDNLPYGSWTTTDGNRYYFNRHYHVIFAGNPLTNQPIATSRDMIIDNINHFKTEYYYDIDDNVLRGDFKKLRLPADVQYQFVKKYHSTQEGCFSLYNGTLHSPFTRMKNVVREVLFKDSLPYMFVESVDGLHYYRSREYHTIFIWDSINEVILPSHRWSLPNREGFVLDYNNDNYVYKSRMDNIRQVRHSLNIMDSMFIKNEKHK